MTPADREGAAIAASVLIECLLPAHVELHRAWAKGHSETRAYCGASFEQEQLRRGDGPAH
jgi:pectin methylesterase-like acyl-CoA thioesterase